MSAPLYGFDFLFINAPTSNPPSRHYLAEGAKGAKSRGQPFFS
jgi:hypothetical protein